VALLGLWALALISNVCVFGMIQLLFTFHNWGLLLLRIVLGVIMVAHGFPKLRNFSETIISFRSMGFRPAFFWVVVAGSVELFGGVFLIGGFFTQIVAFVIAIQFLVVILFVNLRNGFSGLEYDLLILTSSIVLLTSGAGLYSLDDFFGIILY
jgi:putative oxidoreductase